jgi:formate hydrogenlyase subunit 4
MHALIGVVLYLLLAPVAGCLLAGLDRIATARMQRRQGPPLLQPYYDFRKLLSKQGAQINAFQGFYVGGFLVFTALAGGLFFAGSDLLLVIFALTVGGVLLVLAAASAGSPFAHFGAERELIQMLAYEPMLLMTAVGLYLAGGSFRVDELLGAPAAPLIVLPGVLLGFLFILTIKLRKSPFDLSASHHAHQELVRGLTVELSGPHLALVELGHWYENVLLLGILWLFLAPLGWPLAAAGTALAYLLEIVVDNSSSRLRWETTLRASWLAALVLGATNILLLHYLQHHYLSGGLL